MDNGDDAVDVVGHYLELIRPNALIKSRQFIPGFFHHFACGVRNHPAVNDFPEQFLSVLRANGHKIISGLGIIIFPHSVRLPVFHLQKFKFSFFIH